MRLLCRGLLALSAAAGILAAAAAIWLFFYSADLPRTSELQQFTPRQPTEARLDFCDGRSVTVHALPPAALGSYTVAALEAAEGVPDTRSPIRTVADGFLTEGRQHSRGQYSVRLARGLACDERRMLRRALKELRVAEHIHREFATDQVLTIYLNRAYFGEGTFGLEAASTRYFGKHASQLSLGEAATLMGMIRSPGMYSLIEHRDRAIERRNSVIDEMVRNGVVGKNEAALAKASVLDVSTSFSR